MYLLLSQRAGDDRAAKVEVHHNCERMDGVNSEQIQQLTTGDPTEALSSRPPPNAEHICCSEPLTEGYVKPGLITSVTLTCGCCDVTHVVQMKIHHALRKSKERLRSTPNAVARIHVADTQPSIANRPPEYK